jgi:hypothetical protein
MATSSSTTSGTRKPRTGTKKPTTTTRKTAATRRPTASSSTSTQPKTTVGQVQELAERAVLVPIGASLLARENLVSSVKGIATRYRSRASLERELKRYERRGAAARNRFERQVRKTRTTFERELRQRRSRVEKSVQGLLS